jgi:hypothetical protein
MIQLREAVSTDNAGLLNLTSLLPMEGRISIRIDRNPDFFQLLNLRGPGKLFVAENEGKIIGCFSASMMNILVNGNPDTVHYLADLKIHPSWLGSTLTSRLLYVMFDYLRTLRADLLFSTAAFGNEKVMPLFEGRIGLPKFQCIGTFNVYQIIPFTKKTVSSKYTIEEIPLNDDIITFYARFLKRYQYSPVMNEATLQETRNLIVMRNNEIIASLSLLDVGASKQNVLIRLPRALSLLVSLLRKLNKLVKILNLPELNQPIKIMYIKIFAFKEDCEEAFELLINQARTICFKERYCFLTVGIHEKDPLNSFFSQYLHFTFHSLGFMASLSKKDEKIQNCMTGTAYEDYSLI